ncbi:MAG: DUF3299 domain-containing protein [Pseudomonadota bacterium]
MERTLPFAVLGLSLAAMTACGAAPVEDAEPESQRLEASVTTVAAVADDANEQSDEPEIGDRIDDSRTVEAADNSLMAAVRKEQERLEALESRGIREIGWEELMPAGEEEKLAELYQQQMAMLYSGSPIIEGSAADAMVQIGTFNTVPELNELKIRLPGYTVPFEFDANAEITEFLLVPYFGACIHAPPPPPNQTIFVIADDPIRLKDLAQAVWIEGTMFTQTQTSELADAAYTIRLENIETYDY